ncbi:hypothetical protein [Egbenema bharatensis]|uniref:hypothetical protein n=1 Tax=Egbenema bharatensis TaxID=3463334 RepID=UPI003A85BA4B
MVFGFGLEFLKLAIEFWCRFGKTSPFCFKLDLGFLELLVCGCQFLFEGFLPVFLGFQVSFLLVQPLGDRL